jgi:CubicO group peptidase (beta-lactamase class C family)
MTSFVKTRLARIHTLMHGYVERGEVPGIVSLVDRRGETHVDAVGALALGGAPMRRDSLFRIASITKPITAAAAMILVEECRVRLDDSVERWLPELADRKVLRRLDGPLDDTVPARRAITTRDLLTFCMGFGSVMAPPGATPIQRAVREHRLGGDGPPKPQSTPPPDEWMRRLGSLPLMHQPGEQWMYHTSSDVLGVLVARVSDQPLETFLRERIFSPLGMKDTSFSVPAAELARFATSYLPNSSMEGLSVFDEAEGGDWSRPHPFPSGGGGLVSTVDDLLAFGRMMLHGGHHGDTHVLSRRSIELMMTDQLTPAQKAASSFVPGFFDGHGWGFGASVGTRRDNLFHSVGRFGWDGGLGTQWYVDPTEELVGVLLTQRAFTSPVLPDVCVDFWTATYQALDD